MSSRSNSTREAVLQQQNAEVNVLSAAAQNQAHVALRSMTKSTISINPLDSSSSHQTRSRPYLEPSTSPTSKKVLDTGLPTELNHQSSRRATNMLGNVSMRSSNRLDTLSRQSSMRKSQDNPRQQTNLQQLEAQIASIIESNKAMERSTSKMVDQMDQMKVDQIALTRKLEQTQAQLEKQKTIQASLELNYKGSETELTNVHSELDDARRYEKHTSHSAKALQIRVDRVTDELEKVKKEVKDLKDTKGGSAVPRIEFDRMLRDVNHLEKQKSELLTIYKKQSKLIDILKRQKFHLESAKHIAFTEDEFAKTLDWGS